MLSMSLTSHRGTLGDGLDQDFKRDAPRFVLQRGNGGTNDQKFLLPCNITHRWRLEACYIFFLRFSNVRILLSQANKVKAITFLRQNPFQMILLGR